MDDLERGAVKCVKANDLPWRPSAVARGVFVKDIAVTDGDVHPDTGCVFVLVDRA